MAGRVVCSVALVGLVACQHAATRRPQTQLRPAAAAPQVAFLADVHLQDVYGSLGDFAGIPSRTGPRRATLRTMYAQLTSTRLFNENYFVFRAALDDAYRRGVRIVALPGDATDDGQPVNVAALQRILAEYNTKGMRFFLAPGNHDPHKPFDDEGAKEDFLGVDGTNQRIYSTGSAACRGVARGAIPHPPSPDIVCTDQIKRLGYAALLTQLADHGYMPGPQDLYWESPFSQTYDTATYSYMAARQAAALGNRQYEICHEGEGGTYKQPGYTSCAFITDASYLVEPIPGVWLLAIDANVYQPKDKRGFDATQPQSPANYSESSDAGYNAVLTHKRHLLDWIRSVTRRAKAQGKQLIAFSHFPMMEFYNGQSAQLAALFKPDAFQLTRRPLAATTRALAATGLRLHIAGHMHLNNTGVYAAAAPELRGDFLVNVQAPALGVFGAAYKLVTLRGADTVDVQTIALDDVPRFDELFPYYETEWHHLRTSTAREDAGQLWQHQILASKNFHDFTRRYFGELARLRLLDSYWPCLMNQAVRHLDGAQLLTLAQLQTRVTLAQLQYVPDIIPNIVPDSAPLTASCTAAGVPSGSPADPTTLRRDWATATARAAALAQAAGFHLADFARISAYEFYGDFHRTLYAGELALSDLGAARVKQYKVLMAAFPPSPAPIVKVADKPSEQNFVQTVFQHDFAQVFSIFKALGSGRPSRHFVIDFKHQTVVNAAPDGLTFN